MVKSPHFHASTAEVMGSVPGLNPHARWCSKKKKKTGAERDVLGTQPAGGWALS